MLISFAVVLTSASDATLPHETGRAVYAAVLTRLGATAPALAAEIHAADGPKPLTSSTLLGAKATGEGLAVKADQPLTFRVTGLTPTVSEALAAIFLDQPPTTWSLLNHEFAVRETVCDAERNDWTGRTGYESLATARLLSSPSPPPLLKLHFAGPTSFKSKGLHMPIPLPELVFGSLVDRWNAFSPVTVSPEMRRFAAEMIGISRYRLSSRSVAQKQGGLRVGGAGIVSYRAVGGDRYWWRVMQMLGDFALYSGVGIQTTTGMGQTRRL